MDLWFPVKEAAQIKEVRASAFKGGIRAVIDRARGTVLTADLSPIVGVQGQLALLFDFPGTLFALKGLLHPRHFFRAGSTDEYIKDFASDPEGWTNCFRFFGRSPIAAVGNRPEEMAMNYLEMLPKVGEWVSRKNDGMYLILIRRQKQMFDDFVKSLMEYDPTLRPDTVMAEAMDLVKMIIPMVDPQKLGQSTQRAQAWRLPFSSISFLRQPLVFDYQFMKGIVKLATPGQHLTAKERLAIKMGFRFVATVQSISVLTAWGEAARTGRDIETAILETIPGGRSFGSMNLFGAKIPIGGAHRAFINAFIPRGEEPYPAEAAKGLIQWITNKVTPSISSVSELILNKDYWGHQIRLGDDTTWQKAMRSALYLVESNLPLTVGEVFEGKRLDLPAEETLTDMASQFLGSGLNQQSIIDDQTLAMFPGLLYRDLEERFLKDIVTGSEHIAEDLEKQRWRNKRFKPDSIDAMFANIDDLDEERAEALEELATNINRYVRTDEYSTAIFYSTAVIKKQYFEIIREDSIRKNEQYKRFEDTFDTNVNDADPRIAGLAQWNALVGEDRFNLPGGLFDIDALAAARDQLSRSWAADPNGEEIAAYVLRNTNRHHIPEAVLVTLPRKTQERYKESRRAREIFLAQWQEDGRYIPSARP